jgi:hypothetical protein
MEEKVFRIAAVAAELENYVEARLHTDSGDKKKQEEFKSLEISLADTLANPVYVILDPKTEKKLGTFTGATLRDHTPFLRFLQQARQ